MKLLIAILAVAWSGCACVKPTPVTADHPASPEAAEAVTPPAVPVLTTEGSPGAPEQPAAPGVYTCPMHPEVVQDKPGECPKCGMSLVKKKGGGQ